MSRRYDDLEVYAEEPRSGYEYAYRARRKRTLDCVRRVLVPGSRILDVAAAQGNFTLILAEEGYEVTWNDFRAELEGYVRSKHERGVVHYVPGNVLDLAFSRPFDGVLMGEVIEHVAHPDRFLAKVAEFIRPGGWLILTTPNGGYIRNPLPRFSDCKNPERYEAVQFKPDADGHIFLLHDDEIARFAQMAGLELRELAHYGNMLTSGHVKLGRLLPFMPGRLVDRIERFTISLPARARRVLHAGTVAVLQKRSAS